jgi:septal ring factor EnvC (AmiA/AmiB activator)
MLPAAMVVLAICVLVTAHAAPKPSERSEQKQAAEAERSALREKLSTLKREISKTETAKSRAAGTLAESEQAISSANRFLNELNQAQGQTEARLEQLSRERTQLEGTVGVQQKRLAKLLHEQYVSGNEDRMKLLLSGDNPNRINRELQYMSYVSQAQAKLIESLRTNLQTIESNQEQTKNAKLELDEIVQKKRVQKEKLEIEKSKRTALLAQLSGKLVAQRKEAGRLEHDQKRLSSLVDRLSRMIEKQKKAAARKTAVRKTASPKKLAKRTQGEKAPQQVESVPEPVSDGGGAFAGMRGRLRLPVRGTITAKYGSKRDGGPSWKGLFISAPEGAEIRAVAEGKVVFAEALRGFGNLIIVDHGGQYMTIYGNAQALFKHVGDAVKSGDVIAGAGNSGGNEQTGLYFEMRHRGRAFNPLDWVTIR